MKHRLFFFRAKVSMSQIKPLVTFCFLTLAIVFIILSYRSTSIFGQTPLLTTTQNPNSLPNSQLAQMTEASFLNEIRTNFLVPPRTSGSYNLVDSKPGHRYSEHNGTFQLILNILGSNKPGFFIEAGAVDGESLSNTLNLEKDYNWTGLLIEPNPAVFQKLKQKGRKAWAANVCLSDSAGAKNITFEFHQSNPFISRKKGLKNAHDWRWIGQSKKIINVTCLPLFSMLTAINVLTVDFFSLDVEGLELPVLKTIPFDRVFIKIFLIEQNNPADRSISRFMEEKGYIEKPFLNSATVDHLFVHSELENL